MKKNFYSPFFAILIFVMATVSCKKEDIVQPQVDALENTKWLLIQQNFYYPDSYGTPEIRNSIWTFSSNAKIHIFNPLGYISDEYGEWERTPDNKIVIDIHIDDNYKYIRSFNIIDEKESFMKLETEDETIESSQGTTIKVEYIFVKI